MRAECSWPEQFRLTGFNLLLMDSSQERKRNFSPRSSRSSSLSPTRAHVLVGLRKNTGSRLPGYSRFPCELLGETCLLDGEVVAATAGRDHRRRFPRRCMTAKLPSLQGTSSPTPQRCCRCRYTGRSPAARRWAVARMAAPPRPAGCRAAGTSAGRRGVSALTWRRRYVLSRRWRGVARPAVANGPASGASGRHLGRRVDGIWFTVHPDPGRCFIYRPDPGSPGPSDVKRACRIDPTDWAAGGRNTVWAKRRPNYGGPTGPSVRDQEDFTVPFCLRWWPTQL